MSSEPSRKRKRKRNHCPPAQVKGSRGWQSEKTLVECMRYMLNNKVSTDVCFEVGPEDGPTVEIQAHKFMLISRCPVFEEMMSSEMSETENKAEANIRIVDINAKVFKLLLRCEFYRRI